ncbi:MAG: carboxypeptidase regulatory-like domain-containing protein [Bacteroidota bacterium]
MSKLSYYCILFLFFCAPVLAQEKVNKAKIIAQYDSISKVYPKEKLYLHLDKSVYAPSDTLWFKAYLIEPGLNTYSTLSGLIYVDMVSANGTVVQTLSLPTQLGISWGSLVLNPKVYEGGTYTLRGYTNWMQNFGEVFFFKKQIKILSIPNELSNAKSSSASAISINKTTNPTTKKTQDPSIQFLPEGGSWVIGRLQKIAFKAIAPNGKGIAIEGEIKDSKLNQIATFKSNAKGMGYFTAIAESEEIYTAFIKAGKNNYNQQLPKTKTTGTTLIVKNDYTLDSLVITVLSDLTNEPLTMIGQSKGLVSFSANFPADTKRRTIKIAKRLFPTGVSQIVLQSGNQVLNERNFFIHHQDQLQVNLKASSTIYGNRDSIPIQITVNDFNKKPVGGTFSIAITDNNQVMKDEEHDDNILSYFLLSSDLKGEIEDPASYFNGFNAQKHDDLDALCLTQGWVSYETDLSKKPKYRLEKEYTISGRITNLTNKPVLNAKVNILGRNKGMMFGNTTTNENGEFVFKDLPPMDSAVFVLKALTAKGKLGTLGFEVNEFRQLPIKTIAVAKTTSEELLDSIDLSFIAIKQQEYKANRSSGIALNEVVIVGKKLIKGSKNLNGPGEYDQIITREDLEKTKSKTLMELLQEQFKTFHGVPGKGFFINLAPLRLIIDGFDADSAGIYENAYNSLKFYLDYYTVADIEGIEIMRFEGNTSLYQSIYRGRGIFLEITTKSGEGPFLRKAFNTYLLKPMNYGDTKVFYSPKYTSANKADKKPDFRSTIYWVPNVVTNTKGEANISFYSADKKGTYTVWIEGSDMQGKFGMKTMKLEIK